MSDFAKRINDEFTVTQTLTTVSLKDGKKLIGFFERMNDWEELLEKQQYRFVQKDKMKDYRVNPQKSLTVIIEESDIVEIV